jgi:hypothetical protein
MPGRVLNDRSLLVIGVLIATFIVCHTNAFSNPSIHRQPPALTCLNAGFGKNAKPSKLVPNSLQELFELQELRAQLQTIADKNILYQSLSDEKRAELTNYVKAVVEKSESPIDVSGKRNSMGPMQFVANIEGKSWRMLLSTNSSTGGGEAELPYGSTVILRIGELDGAKGMLEYVLKFSKQVMGLKELVAKSTCEVDVSSLHVLSCF